MVIPPGYSHFRVAVNRLFFRRRVFYAIFKLAFLLNSLYPDTRIRMASACVGYISHVKWRHGFSPAGIFSTQ